MSVSITVYSWSGSERIERKVTTGNGNGVGKTGTHKQTKVMHPKERRPHASSHARTVQIVFTVHTETGEIFQVERVDDSGRRRELTDEECADLVDYGYSD